MRDLGRLVVIDHRRERRHEHQGAVSTKEGAFDTSTTTEAPFSASPNPSSVIVLTPELGKADTASCPGLRSLLTTFDPMSPLPPITTIFIIAFSFLCSFFCTDLSPALIRWVASSHNDSRLFNSTSATFSLLKNLPRLQAARIHFTLCRRNLTGQLCELRDVEPLFSSQRIGSSAAQ